MKLLWSFFFQIGGVLVCFQEVIWYCEGFNVFENIRVIVLVFFGIEVIRLGIMFIVVGVGLKQFKICVDCCLGMLVQERFLRCRMAQICVF